ncbi:MAG: hypothetical protein R3D00_21510 [Bacteroidia bacterium]
MKKITVLLGVLGAILLVISQFLRILHWPGGAGFNIAGLVTVSLFALGVAIHSYRTYREDHFSQKIDEIGKEEDEN